MGETMHASGKEILEAPAEKSFRRRCIIPGLAALVLFACCWDYYTVPGAWGFGAKWRWADSPMIVVRTYSHLSTYPNRGVAVVVYTPASQRGAYWIRELQVGERGVLFAYYRSPLAIGGRESRLPFFWSFP